MKAPDAIKTDSFAGEHCRKRLDTLGASFVGIEPRIDFAVRLTGVHLYQSERSGNFLAHGVLRLEGKLGGHSERYAYDRAERLVLSERRPWAVDAAAWVLHLPAGEETALTALLEKKGKLEGLTETRAYTLDAADNLTEVRTPAAGWTGVVNANNQYTQAKGKSWRYDESGNLTDDGERRYTWDGANRLVGVGDRKTGQRHEFEYDGQSRLTVERTYANAAARPVERRYLWCGEQICQLRDGADNALRNYYAEGEMRGDTPLYYVRDHLGSVTDVIDAQGYRRGSLDYGPYGENLEQEGLLPDFGYAGMYRHASGLYLTHYRFYDPEAGRWLNRDPIGEHGGTNLYA
ncbi:MAG: RHS repeat-associated core domain-containing protein, partial [Zoogloeaceae bacterium]|nr:RHS repeat-associated core domain-containing protein [Zoogloeaceae bacterium]